MMPLKITAHLASPVAMRPPRLDSLLIASVLKNKQPVQRFEKCPSFGNVDIPLEIVAFAGVPVYKCSDPIFVAAHERHEFRQKYIDANRFASLVCERNRVMVTATKFGWMKRYFRPIRTSLIDRVVWFAVGDCAVVALLLDRISSIGGERSRGYGRVNWDVSQWHSDFSITVPTERGAVLMRPIPVESETSDLVGWRYDFGACQPPYYHPERQREILAIA